MNVNAKQFLCLALAFVIAVGLLPAAASAAEGANPFEDVKLNDWYANAVQYVYDNKLMVGVSANSFDPGSPTTRGMVVTVLHRMAGSPSASGAGFTDVNADAWYADAILWAQSCGIIEGYGDGTFHPDESMTREDMVAVFYRYSKHKGWNVAAKTALGIYTDSVTIQSYAEDAMGWAVSAGLIQGFPDGTIRPQENSNRAQLATVLMRYAGINQIPDNGSDDEDTEVTTEDKALLTASKREVLAQSATDVMFYVNSTLTVPCFELFIDGKSTGVFLYDNGNYSENGDDIPNDGCYTGIYKVNFQEEKDYSVTAKAVVGENTVVTNSIALFVYYELTDAELDEMDAIDSQIQQIISKTRKENASASKETLIGLLRQNILEYLHSLEAAGQVYGIIDDPANYIISFKLASGLSDGVRYYDPNEDANPGSNGTFSNGTSTGTAQERGTVTPYTVEKNVSIDVDYVTYRERALLLCYDAPVANENDGSLDDIAANLAASLTEAGFSVDERYSVTVSDFKNMQDYDYIHVGCHGTIYSLWTGLFTYESTPVICTPETATKASKKAYSADLKKDRIVCVDNTYFLRPSFFDFYYDEDPLQADIIALGCCKGGSSSHLADSLVNAGASAVLAYSDTVYTAYDYMMSDEVLNQLYEGHTVSEALAAAKDLHGDDDLVWGAAQRDGGNTNFATLKSERAECLVFGNEGRKLHHTLLNGNFDSIANVMGSNISIWKRYGDARSIFRLAGLEAVSSPKMAVISSGFGSMGNETTSSIYQTFLVPGDATTIKFHYNVVSEEPMEYVGSVYNDVFQVDLLDTSGKVLETLAAESINTSTWYAIDGIDFPGGDDTTYHTRWTTVSSDVLSKYRGQLVVIRFVVQDAGDSIYDTAALIDSVTVS